MHWQFLNFEILQRLPHWNCIVLFCEKFCLKWPITKIINLRITYASVIFNVIRITFCLPACMYSWRPDFVISRLIIHMAGRKEYINSYQFDPLSYKFFCIFLSRPWNLFGWNWSSTLMHFSNKGTLIFKNYVYIESKTRCAVEKNLL